MATQFMRGINYYPATLLCDFYKISHREQYPEKSEKIYATWTPRATRLKGVNHVVAFGIQAFVKEFLLEYFDNNFFNRPEADVVQEYVRIIRHTLSVPNPDASHIIALHKLGYLPIEIRAVAEGTKVPIRCPMATIENTIPEFYWFTNYLETLWSCQDWLPLTSATIANEYRCTLDHYAKLTGGDLNFVSFQGHDFSMRGMGGLHSAILSGAGHLTSFIGTDTIPAILFMERFYNVNMETYPIGTSIPATEHSVQCAGGKDNEFETYERLITKVYPSGFVSIVSDTWDLWYVLTNVLPRLKTKILARDGKLVIRPDSGDPVKIICGYKVTPFADADCTSECVLKDGKYYTVKTTNTNRHGWELDKELSLNEVKGVIQLLWEVFGGTENAMGFKCLDSHIGAIYGDAITIARAEAICQQLMEKGFCSTNVVFGIGSFTYQYNTRDTFGFALKTTYARIDGKEIFLFKDPVTDKEAIKKSQCGMLVVLQDGNGELYFKDHLYEADRAAEAGNDLLKVKFRNGKIINDENLVDIRAKIRSYETV